MRRTLPFLLSGLAALAAACGGGGPAADSTFQLLSISLQEGSICQLNRPIRLTFDADIDFASVDLNTVHVARTNGAPATGAFTLDGPRTIVFQPACPTLPDDSDAGLLRGGVPYRIDLPGAESGAASLRSTAGAPLAHSFSLDFVTPVSADPAVLFIDLLPGPPAPVIRSDPSVADACYVEIGGDPGNRVYFQPRASADPDLGADVPAGYVSGLNLHADLATRVAIVLAIDQPVNPSTQSIQPNAVRLEYEDSTGAWRLLAHDVELAANCTGTGARVRVTPRGILPQNHLVRVVLTQDFTDLVGDGNLIPLAVGAFLVGTATDPDGTAPGDGADELFEDFSTPAGADLTTPLENPRADWGEGGTLRAGFAFDGTGGPGGAFDWQFGHASGGSPQTFLLDTSFTVITNAEQTLQEYVIGGRVDVRNFTLLPTGTISVQGPNPLRITASGFVRIEGRLLVTGTNDLGVNTLGNANIPEPGAPGQAGGGRGGTGSYLSSQSTPQGQAGFGAFDIPDGGGIGGESGYYPNPEPEGDRRAGGGGGGTFGRDFLRPAGIVAGYTNPNGCPDQALIGLDAEPGFPGAPTAMGALHPGFPPVGGPPGPRPFYDDDPTNDFWGTMKTQSGALVHGELAEPWAGAGGGAGGNSITSATFPPPTFDPASDEKGSGGGGGGGSITILALGDISLGPSGRIDASGGTGGGGEDQFPTRRVAGGSGGGSGGHIVLQTAAHIDLSQCSSAAVPPGGLFALGGQGGEGADDHGGSHFGSTTSVELDALPLGAYPNTSGPCGVVSGQAGYTYSNTVGNADPTHGVVCCGGDGGPGIIQLHAPTLASILVPTTAGDSVYTVCRPPPIGSTPVTGVPSFARINDPSLWDQLVPIFGRMSQALSKWIQIGAASVSSDPASSTPDVVRLAFEGTDASGVVSTTGSGSAARVAVLPPVLAGTLQSGTTPPYVASDGRTVVFDGGPITDDIYVRTPALLRRCSVRLTHGVTHDFAVAAATFDPASGELFATVEGSGTPLGAFVPGDGVALCPRFFSVITSGVPDSLPSSSRITVEFQAALPNSQGDPDENAASAWVADVGRLDPNRGANPDYRFFRFRVAFDISVNGAPLTFDTPVPSLDFFRIPFRF